MDDTQYAKDEANPLPVSTPLKILILERQQLSPLIEVNSQINPTYNPQFDGKGFVSFNNLRQTIFILLFTLVEEYSAVMVAKDLSLFHSAKSILGHNACYFRHPTEVYKVWTVHETLHQLVVTFVYLYLLQVRKDLDGGVCDLVRTLIYYYMECFGGGQKE